MADYATTAKVKTAMSVTHADHDAFIADLITRCSRRLEKICDRVFFAADYTEYHSGDGTDAIVLEQFPVNSVATIHDDTDRVFGADCLLSSSDYFINAAKGIVSLIASVFTRGRDNVKVVYNAGYSTIPSDIEDACIKLVIADYIEEKGIVAVMEGDSVIYKPNILRKQAEQILEAYKKWKV